MVAKGQSGQPLMYYESTRETNTQKQDDLTIMTVNLTSFDENELFSNVSKSEKVLSGGIVDQLQILVNTINGLKQEAQSHISVMSYSKDIRIFNMTYNKSKGYIYIKEGSVGSYEYKNICIYMGKCHQ